MASDWRILNKVGPPRPPSALNKETVGVWNGWGTMGDKEVAREAAAKGTHVDLAITFLSLRKNLELSLAKDWFRSEIVKWAEELVDRKQIFKASHVFNNIGLDPVFELTKIFRATTDMQLREYVGNHLSKIEKFDDNMRNLQNFLRLFTENSALISEHRLAENNIESLETQGDVWRAKVATTLFLQTDDGRLVPFLTSEALWNHLLANNNVELLRTWIHLRYNKKFNPPLGGKLIEQFRKFSITSEMLNADLSTELEVSTEIENVIYDELSKFGVFRDIEANNFLVILKRLKNSASIGHLYEIFSQSISVVDVDSFVKLLVEFCEEKKLYSILNACLKDFELPSGNTKQLNLISDFRALVKYFNEEILKNNILEVVDALCGDVATYFSDNPIMLLALILFTKDLQLENVITKKLSLLVGGINLDKSFEESIRKLPTLAAICDNKTKGFPKCQLTIYDLIEKHLKIEPALLFKFRVEPNEQLLHLNHKALVQDYGYSKTIDYKFYLKQATPSTAASLFISKQLQMYKFVNNEDLKTVERKVYKLAINNFSCDEITSSCITFLELIKVNSLGLRVKVTAARLLLKSGYDKESVLEILFNSDDDPYTLQTILESVLMDSLHGTEISNGRCLIEAIRSFEIVLQYSKLNNLKLPELFLKNLASANLWLPLLLFAQINNYPLEQMKLITQFLKNPTLAEHVTHSVLNDVSVEEKDILMRENDSKKYFLSKVGVHKSIEVLSENLSHHSTNSQSSDNSSDIFEIDVSIKATLLQTLIRCHNSTDPPKALLQACQLYRNPMLAIFATTYEPDSIIVNWLTWLAVSCEVCHTFTNYESVAMSANSVADLLENCMRKQFPRALHESFEIFIPANPLKVFVEFLKDCIKFDLDPSVLATKLQTFQASLKNARKNSIITESDREMTYLNNRIWIETTALKLLAAALQYNCNSLYEQILVIEAVSHVEIWNYFSIECPNFLNILEVLKSLARSNSGVRLDITLMFDSQNRRKIVINCINSLLDKQSYGTALEIAQMENLPPDLVLTKEWESKFEGRSQENFWASCDRVFNEFKVTADCVVEFYVYCSEKIENLLEKYSVLKLATDWATKFELSCRFELEKKMWLSFLRLDEKLKSYDDLGIKPTFCLYCEVVDLLKTIPENDVELSKDFVKQIDRLVIYVLNKGNFWQALKLQKMFGCRSTDLETLKLCHSLAEGILLPYQLNAEQRLLLTNVNYLRNFSRRRTFLSTRLSSFSSCSHFSSYSPGNSSLVQTISEGSDSINNDVLSILKLLAEHLHNGAQIGQNVFMTYRISVNIEIPYHVVIASSDYMNMLKSALEDDCMNKLDVIRDFISVYKWSRNEIADFICETLVNAVSLFVTSNQTRLIMWDLDLDQDFQSVLQLLQENSSILGHKIYSYASAIHRSQIEADSTSADFVLVVELMIRAHDCFTADCNMEGISLILKKSKELISNLLSSHNWKLIVRLLTGVARYTEMNYVFQILMQNDQFEFLLRKGSCKDNTFKTALLEYLKKFCPDNRELYRIVALHFTLFSEVAILWEREARSVITNLISISKLEMQNNRINPDEEPFVLFQNTDGTRMCLKKAMDNYTHATEFHLQGGKLAKAMNAANQAELIALQLSLLNEGSSSKGATAVCLLSLVNNQINTLISTKLGYSFEQSLILVEAYSFHVDWASVLHEQYVVRNNAKFLEGFLQHLPLTDGLVRDISRKFINSDVISPGEIKAMKSILNRLPTVHFKYKIASELGFTDLVEDLIESGQLVYLKDTVWKKGYRN